VALRLALERPATVGRLVLIEPVLMAAARVRPDYQALLSIYATFEAALAAGDPMLAARRFTEVWGTGVAWLQMREDQRRSMAGRIGVIPAQNGALFDDSAGLLNPGRLEALDKPVLLMEGAQSPEVVAAVLDTLQDRLPNATRRCIEGAGHMLPITHPGDVAEIVKPFLTA
jgi:pimeloyl-ACP methyl ester carboxylesterase